MGWLVIEDSHEVGIVDGRVVARALKDGVAGKQLKTIPAAIRDHADVEQLRRLAAWLADHGEAVRSRVENWMVSSLPIPTAVLTSVWADEAWCRVLTDLVVLGDGPDETGFLRGVQDGCLQVVNLEGETVRLAPSTVKIPHPVHLADLEELREFAAELGVHQQLEQIHRATWIKPQDAAEQRREAARYEGGTFRVGFGLVSRARSLGYQTVGVNAECLVRDGEQVTWASVQMGDSWEWDGPTQTGPLTWRNTDGHQLAFDEVGAVAWSEGMRMAAALYAGSSLAKDDSEEDDT